MAKAAAKAGAPPPLRAYLVGGAVRDELLDVPGKDRDYVVVGETPERMVARGFKPVGKDFPVFIHPDTGDEYALARTERKMGRGYRGFTFHYAPDVTLEDDLKRRDLTINAMARTPEGELVDPYGGLSDLKEGVLRHVSGAFAEDPLRLLRVARFGARYGFRVAEETRELLGEIVRSGEVDHLVAERTWAELRAGLGEPKPSVMFGLLDDCGALERILPGLGRKWRETYAGGGEFGGKPWGRLACARIDEGAKRGCDADTRFALLLDDGEADEAGALALVRDTCARLKVPTKPQRQAKALAKARRRLRTLAAGPAPEAVLDVLAALDWPRSSGLSDAVLLACETALDLEDIPGARQAADRVRGAARELVRGPAAKRIRALGGRATKEEVRRIRVEELEKIG